MQVPDSAELKRLVGNLTPRAGSAYVAATDRLESIAPELAAELVALRERLATVEGERDEARAEAAELKERIDLALKILDDPDDLEAGICRATEALWGEKPEVPAQVGDEE